MTMKFLRWRKSIPGQDADSQVAAMELKKDQQEALDEFRRRVGHIVPEYFKPDHELLRWLVARKFDVDRAENMILKSLEWRKKYDMENILTYEPTEVLRRYYALGYCGLDKEGYPVWIVPYGGADVKGILQSTTHDDYIKYTVQVMEKGPRVLGPQTASKRKEKEFRQSVIFDLANFSIRHFTWKPVIDAVTEIIQINEANYPELLRKAYVINAPMLFQVTYAAIKPFLAVETLEKVQIFGTTGWKEALLADIDADQLPVHYGGTMTDPDGDPKCPSKINYGGEVPKKYYLKNKKMSSSTSKSGDFETLVLPSSGRKVFDFDVPQEGYHISWEFETDDFDIGFGVSRMVDGEEEWLIPLQRVNSQIVSEEGTVVCTKSGTYKVTFDNEFSYVRSKNLRYKLTLLSPSAADHTKF